MLEESKLLSFIDNNNGFAVTFFEGQKLIHDLALINNLTPKGFNYFRDAVLTIQPMIAFLKHGEGFGLYIDSESPYFRLKIETNESGAVRTLLLPEDFKETPTKITGICRLSKIFNRGTHPYTSVIQLNELSFDEIINKILRDSYQINCKIFISDSSDQSIMLMRLPDVNVNSTLQKNRPSTDEYWMQNKTSFNQLFKQGTTDREIISNHMKSMNMDFLKEKEVKFSCPCSKERMIQGIKGIEHMNLEDIFAENGESIDAKCDYCKKTYRILKSEVDAN